MYFPNAARTDSRKSSNVLKYFRCVAFFLVFLQSFSMGLKSGEKEGNFIKKWNAAAEKGNIKTLDAVHMDYMRISKVTSPKSTVHRLMKRHGWKKMKSENGTAVWKMS